MTGNLTDDWLRYAIAKQVRRKPMPKNVKTFSVPNVLSDSCSFHKP
jgi:hypothetical protein